MKIIFPITRT